MKRFAALFEALETTTATGLKVAAMTDYFREARMGEKTLGQVHDDTWGQIEALEARI